MLGANALPAASHLVMILVITVSIGRLARADGTAMLRVAVERFNLMLAVSLFGLALVIERIYYVAARVLIGYDVDLWKMHPAPELLSLTVCAGAYAIGLPIIRARLGTWRKVGIRASIEVMVLLGIWALFVEALR